MTLALFQILEGADYQYVTVQSATIGEIT